MTIDVAPRTLDPLARTQQEEEIIAACPLQAGPVHTTLRDLALSVEWSDLRVLELASTGWAIILGHKRRHEPLRAVLPLPLHTTALRPSSLRAIFQALEALSDDDIPHALPDFAPSVEELQERAQRGKQVSQTDGTRNVGLPDPTDGEENTPPAHGPEVINKSLDRDMIYVAIVTTDSTVVYYKLTKGIKKPADIPDE
ncbi:hypothetical protein BD324DRAFT_386889 [Kockovaella imperatae]|uniref:tRNA-splicing endonuclease subunit Sen15 domain-containing protein n=1 Tax=Kockovaella imperatae TaxID=4999 RepID=A0A1Y1UHS9_9TREE|nr:hypothetical protein BD324DRAFT_386889 [Kockovaella imperatae]ORX37598.1 hypothetical protein BD324DRAFT_386889 [Kockovaella imperatae]